MTYKGIVKGKLVELEGDVILPEGTRVSVIPEETATVNVPEPSLTLKAWLQEARQTRSQLPKTSDSAEILRQLREERANR
jgi:hypothetical protein